MTGDPLIWQNVDFIKRISTHDSGIHICKTPSDNNEYVPFDDISGNIGI